MLALKAWCRPAWTTTWRIRVCSILVGVLLAHDFLVLSVLPKMGTSLLLPYLTGLAGGLLFFTKQLGERISPRRLIPPACIANGVAMLVIAGAPPGPLRVAALVLLGVCSTPSTAIVRVAIKTRLAREGNKDEEVTRRLASVTLVGYVVVGVLAVLFGAIVVDAPATVFTIAICLAFATALPAALALWDEVPERTRSSLRAALRVRYVLVMIIPFIAYGYVVRQLDGSQQFVLEAESLPAPLVGLAKVMVVLAVPIAHWLSKRRLPLIGLGVSMPVLAWLINVANEQWLRGTWAWYPVHVGAQLILETFTTLMGAVGQGSVIARVGESLGPAAAAIGELAKQTGAICSAWTIHLIGFQRDAFFWRVSVITVLVGLVGCAPLLIDNVRRRERVKWNGRHRKPRGSRRRPSTHS